MMHVLEQQDMPGEEQEKQGNWNCIGREARRRCFLGAMSLMIYQERQV